MLELLSGDLHDPGISVQLAKLGVNLVAQFSIKAGYMYCPRMNAQLQSLRDACRSIFTICQPYLVRKFIPGQVYSNEVGGRSLRTKKNVYFDI